MKGSRGKPWLSVMVGLGAAVLLWARAPFASRNFWAEDGKLLFAQAMEDGWIEVPEGPGLGVEINREVLEQYSC